jgi:predicted GNAT family N-acyltransferase
MIFMVYQTIEQFNQSQISELLELYQNKFWSQERTHEDIIKMLAASDIIVGLVDETEALIGFTRILTDFIYRAIIFDVIIKPSHRNMGLSNLLMNAVINHPKLTSVEHFALWCLPEMTSFYENWDFTTKNAAMQLMFRKNHSNQEMYYDN